MKTNDTGPSVSSSVLTLQTRQPDGAVRTTAELCPPPEFLLLYRIEASLGCGAMGAVYRARQLSTDRPVAIKVLLRAGDAEQLVRFEREGRVMAELRHPNVVQVYDAGSISDFPYLVTEFVDGGTLAELMAARGAIPWREAVALALAALEGLAACHERGIVHRDLKPANILLTRDGHPKIADLGLARSDKHHLGLTVTGALVGTPVYMAPEQFAGEEVTLRSDVYSMGAILYELITGQRLFRAGSLVSLFAERERGREVDLAPSLRAGAPDIPARVVDAVGGALSTQPELRHASAAELASALRSGGAIAARGSVAARHRAAAPSPTAHPSSELPPARRAHWFAAAVIGACTLAAVGVRPADRNTVAERPASASSAAMPLESSAPSPGSSLEDVDAGFSRACQAEAEGRFAEADQLCRALLRRAPDPRSARNGKLRLVLATSLYHSGDLDGAETVLRPLVREHDLSEAHIILGELEVKRGRHVEAAAGLEDAIRRWPDSFWLWKILGDARFAANQFAEAERAFRTAVNLQSPEERSATAGLARTLRRLGRPAAARPLLADCVAKSPRNLEWRMELAVCLLELARPDAAEAHLIAAIEISPNHGTAYPALEKLYGEKRALDWEKLLRKRAGASPPSWLASTTLAELLIARGDIAGAEAVARAALDLCGRPQWLLLVLARCEMARGDRAAAERSLRESWTKNHAHAATAILLADLLKDSGRAAEALTILATARRAETRDPWLPVCYARHLEESGRREDAVVELTGFLSTEPGHAPSIRALAELLERCGRTAEAFARHDRARAISPETANWAALARLAPEDQRERVLRAWLEKVPKATEARIAYSALLRKTERHAEAERVSLAALADQPESEPAVDEALAVLDVRGQSSAVIDLIRRHAASHACPLELQLSRVRLLLKYEAYAPIVEVGRQGLKRFPENPELQLVVGQSLFRLGRTPEALAVVAPLHARSPTAATHATLGLIQGASGRHLEAERNLREAVRLAPDADWARGALSEYLRAGGRARDAEDALIRTASPRPTPAPPRPIPSMGATPAPR